MRVPYVADLLKFWKGNTDVSFIGSAGAATGYITAYSTKHESVHFNRRLENACSAAVKKKTKVKGRKKLRQALFAVGASLGRHRRVSHHEMLWKSVQGSGPYIPWNV